MDIVFEVPGRPRGKGRPRFTKAGHAFTPKTTKDYEESIRSAFKESEMGHIAILDKPAQVFVSAWFKPPTRLRKADRQRAIDFSTPHTRKPDGDNILKAVCDALNGLAWDDDSQVYFANVAKYHSEREYLLVKIAYDC